MEHRKKYDVGVIGGGVVGCAIAYSIAATGQKVALIEKNEICSGTSGTNPGFCVLTYREDPVIMNIALSEIKKLEKLSELIGTDVEYRKTGGLIYFSNIEQQKEVEKIANACKRWGLKEAEIVGNKKVHRQEPALNLDAIKGALYCPLEGKLNPFYLTIGLAKKARELGADIFTNTEIIDIELENKNVKRVVAKNGDAIYAENYVLATGAWTKEICHKIGEDIPVFYERGEAMVSMKVPRIIKGIVTDSNFFLAGESNKDKFKIGSCLAQTESGNVVITQATSDVNNYDLRTTLEGQSQVAQRTLEYFPSLKDVDIIRTWGGIAAFTKDRLPIFDYLEKAKNMLVVVGFHSSIGIATALGDLVRESYKTGRIKNDLQRYNLERFTN